MQVWVEQDALELARENDEKDDDGKGDGDLVEHEPNAFRLAAVPSFGIRVYIASQAQTRPPTHRSVQTRSAVMLTWRRGGGAYQGQSGGNIYKEGEPVAKRVEVEVTPAADDRAWKKQTDEGVGRREEILILIRESLGYRVGGT